MRVCTYVVVCVCMFALCVSFSVCTGVHISVTSVQYSHDGLAAIVCSVFIFVRVCVSVCLSVCTTNVCVRHRERLIMLTVYLPVSRCV